VTSGPDQPDASRDADITSVLAENAALRAKVAHLREQLTRMTAPAEPPARPPVPSRPDHLWGSQMGSGL